LLEGVASGVGVAGDRKVSSRTAEDLPHNEIASASKARYQQVAAKPAPPKRLGLADLKRIALARKAVTP
jgi:hypothetical protein